MSKVDFRLARAKITFFSMVLTLILSVVPQFILSVEAQPIDASVLHTQLLAAQPMTVAAPQDNPDPASGLRIEFRTAYNFVVDSNVSTPATYAPQSAYIGAQICNDGSQTVDNVVAYIGDYTPTRRASIPSPPSHRAIGSIPETMPCATRADAWTRRTASAKWTPWRRASAPPSSGW